MTGDFDWSENKDSVVLRGYGDVAIYTNPNDDVVIRQSSSLGEDDAVVIIPFNDLARVIKALQALKKTR